MAIVTIAATTVVIPTGVAARATVIIQTVTIDPSRGPMTPAMDTAALDAAGQHPISMGPMATDMSSRRGRPRLFWMRVSTRTAPVPSE